MKTKLKIQEYLKRILCIVMLIVLLFPHPKAQDGIYAYDVVNRKSEKILSGTDNFEIKGIEDNKLKYDNKSVKLGE